MRLAGGWSVVEMINIETSPRPVTKEEARKRERELAEEYDANLNAIKAHTTEEEKRTRHAEWRAENAEKRKASQAKYYAEYSEKVKASHTKYRSENPEKRKTLYAKRSAERITCKLCSAEICRAQKARHVASDICRVAENQKKKTTKTRKT